MMEICEGMKVPVYDEKGLCITPITGLPFTATQTIVVTYCRRSSVGKTTKWASLQSDAKNTKEKQTGDYSDCSLKTSLHSASLQLCNFDVPSNNLSVFKRL